MKLTELSGTSLFRPLPELHLRLTGWGSLQHPQTPSCIGNLYGYSLRQLFVTLRMSDTQVIAISTTEIIFLLTSFALLLRTKFLKKINEKDKKFQQNCATFLLTCFMLLVSL